MVSHGNHPLDQAHYDDIILEEYVLGQMLPDEEEAIRQHLVLCAACRAKVAEYQAACQKIKADLSQELNHAAPGPGVSFDPIAVEWRKPPRRVNIFYRLPQLTPSTSSVVMLGLFIVAFLLLMPSSDTAALRSLDLVHDYNGPPALMAASTDHGLVILHLEDGEVEIVSRLSYMIDPRNLQFSPDGRWLALQQGSTLHIIETRDQGARIRVPLQGTADWSWSPDSRLLAYTDGAGQLAVFDVMAQTSQVLVPVEECAWGMPVWTNDGQRIAYASVMPLPTGGSSPYQQSIWRVDPATGLRVELARNPAPGETLLVPASWIDHDTALVTWDINAGAVGSPPTLYQVDAAAHTIRQIQGQSLAQGMRLAWPVSFQGIALAVHRDRLVFLHLDEGRRQYIPDQLPRPCTIAWAPNGAWMAYTISGAAEGQGLYLFALQDGKLRQIELPKGAIEKAVSWAGPEHLFVIRQPPDSAIAELWLVSLTTNDSPQRILTNVRMPQTGPYVGWRWQDVLAMQALPDLR